MRYHLGCCFIGCSRYCPFVNTGVGKGTWLTVVCYYCMLCILYRHPFSRFAVGRCVYHIILNTSAMAYWCTRRFNTCLRQEGGPRGVAEASLWSHATGMGSHFEATHSALTRDSSNMQFSLEPALHLPQRLVFGRGIELPPQMRGLRKRRCYPYHGMCRCCRLFAVYSEQLSVFCFFTSTTQFLSVSKSVPISSTVVGRVEAQSYNQCEVDTLYVSIKG